MIPGRMERDKAAVCRYLPAFVLLLALVLPSCAQVPVHIEAESGIPRDKTLAVFAEHGDPFGAKAKLEALLRSRGFRIVPGLADNPDFVLRFRYLALGGPLVPTFREFQAVVVDPRTTRTRVSAYFTGNRPPAGVLEEFVAKMAELVP